MTMRGFLACYLGVVVAVGAVGGSAYEGLRHRHAAMEMAAAKPISVAEATPAIVAPPAPSPVPAVTPTIPAPAPAATVASTPTTSPAAPPAQPPNTASWPKLRPHVATAVAPRRPVWPRTAVAHAPAHHQTIIARSEAPVYASEPYAPPPPPPPSMQYYGYPGYYPYGGYYAYYPRYGYYRSF